MAPEHWKDGDVYASRRHDQIPEYSWRLCHNWDPWVSWLYVVIPIHSVCSILCFPPMSQPEDHYDKQRETFRETHPHPSSPRRRRLPIQDENSVPSRIDAVEQNRRTSARQVSRNVDLLSSPKRKRPAQRRQLPLSATTVGNVAYEDNTPSSSSTAFPRRQQLTPPPTQRAVEESGLTRQQIAQRQRRLREKEAKERLGQQQRQQREQENKMEGSSRHVNPPPAQQPPSMPPAPRLIDLRNPPRRIQQSIRRQLFTPPQTQTQTAQLHARLESNQEREREERVRRERLREEEEEEDNEEAVHQERVRQEAARQERERQEVARQEGERQEAARRERAHEEARRQRVREEEAARQEREREEEAARQEREREEEARRQREHDEEARRQRERDEREGLAREARRNLMPPENEELSEDEADQEMRNQAQELEQELGRRNIEDEERQPQARPYINPFLNTRGAFCAARRPYVEPIAQHDLGRMNRECPSCGALHWIQERTAGSVASPQFGMCCDKGKVQLPDLLPPPPLLRELLDGETSAAKDFRENIAQYNSALAFTSVGVKTDEAVNHVGRGRPVFRIHGELKHWSGSLLPLDNQAPSYSQLYILDPHAALAFRMQRNGNLDEHTMQRLQDLIHDVNPYAPLYLTAHEILQDYPDSENRSVRLRLLPGQDRRRYNEPRVDEVAVLVPDNENQTANTRDIVLRLRVPDGDFPLQRVWDTHPAYTPLHYVLLFPYGEPGWGPDLRLHEPNKDSPSRLTITRFVAYRLHSRLREDSLLLRGGRLFQRYLVDMWASADQQRLSYIRHNQKALRAELYQGLQDAVSNDDVDLRNVGRQIILPSSYVGGPRYMHQRFQDAMAIIRHYRKVDLFITVTANPTWPEVLRELLPRQTPYDRPELVARVFKLKKKAIIDDIYKHGIFGRPVAYVYTIEFQKRGLPHMHLLVVLQDGYKLLTPEDVDTCIRAYWPDPETEPLLFEIVKNNMVHGPCGDANRNCVCMENGRCQKNFPKDFQERTTMDENGYPKYKRPNDGRKYKVGRHWVDNSWIVPYCPLLSVKYGCHINVECVATIAAVKYTVKYVHKGADRGSLEVGERDEVKTFIEGRYFSCAEASWRTFHFDIHDQDPPVQTLQVHLEGEHMVAFDPDDDRERIADRAAFSETSLTAFFKANAQPDAAGAEARQLLYQDFPARYVFEKANLKHRKPAVWRPRKKGFSIGRMYFVPPTGGERFYLRKLLTVVRGPTSFADLRTFRGVVHNTYRDACVERGLLSDDREWHQCLEEAKLIKSGRQLRQLFATILLFCHPTKPEDLWATFRADLCDDLEYRLRSNGRENITEDDIFDYGLFLVDGILQESGRYLKDFPNMPEPAKDWAGVVGNALIAEQLNYNKDQERARAEARVAQMNDEQLAAYNAVMGCVNNEERQEPPDGSCMFFLDGPGGTGKTFVYNTLCHAVRGMGEIVICVASTGIAALILPGGRTGHSMFKIPIEDLTAQSTCAIPKNSARADLIRMTRLIIYDEAPMQHKYGFEAIDRTLRDLKGVDQPFGGIPIVFGGDFKQILPVIPKGSREDIVTASLRRSYLWGCLRVLKLRRNMRLSQDASEQDFASWLLDIGNGKDISYDDATISFPSHMRVPTYNSLIEYVYPDVHPDAPSAPAPEYFLDRAILAPRNVDVFATNAEVLERMPGEESVFYSEDTILDDKDDMPPLPEEFLRGLDPAGLPPGELHLKVGCPLILLRNLAPVRGLCNGTRMVVVRAERRVLEVKLIGGEHHGEHAFIPRIKLIPSDKSAMPFTLQRLQYPVRLAFAMSINKSQGQSIKTVGLDLRTPVFSHGQLYVALSRVTSSRRLKILLPEESTQCRTVNVVYDEVLLDHV